MPDTDAFPTRYDPAEEGECYRRWEAAGAFRPSTTSRTGDHFSIVLPPPNVTGTLHVGHAVMLALEDMMVRYHRMKGDRTLWIPGVDHAAIATQYVVEKQLKKANVQGRRTRHELGREAFVREVEAFAEQSKTRILEQVRAMGASLDWQRFAYTLDAPRQRVVREMFVRMYDAGVLYRGNRIVNWCPRCKSTLADDEVIYREERTPFYYFQYGPVVIGTARPETKFQDKTLVVHPDDARYQSLIGQTFAVPWIEGEALQSGVIADPIIDASFGTGAMTITPAHSFDDFALATRHGLPIVRIIDENGVLTDAAGSFAGRNAREARADIVAALQKKGLVVRVDADYVHNLSVCYRCETPIEPLPKLQWFVDVNKPFRNGASLKDCALAAVGDGAEQIHIVPDRFTKEYFHWMTNLRDWCISRQIWFGHRIPAWYRGSEMVVGAEPPAGEGWEQDPDTLDTWFSAGTWTFSTLLRPDHEQFSDLASWIAGSPDIAAFHPTSVLETGYDILFFWIARMILMTEFALGTVPFRTVYLHGLVRDAQGRKMSKSLGNVIDPLDMVAKYGADAVRLALFIGTTPGMDTKLDEQKIAGYAKFITKMWNIARYVSLTIGDAQVTGTAVASREQWTAADHWIVAKRAEVVRAITEAYETFSCSEAAQLAYDFAWHDFADWYLEATKVQQLPHQRALLLETLEMILALLHPAMPFVTEALWERTRMHRSGTAATLIIAPWPEISRDEASTDRSEMFACIRELATAIRQVRSDRKIEPKTLVAVVCRAPNPEIEEWLHDAETIALVERFGRVQGWSIQSQPEGAPDILVRDVALYVHIP